MSLIRLLILTGIVLAAVPVDTDERMAVINTIKERATYALSTCERDPVYCEEAQRTLSELQVRAQHALVMAFSLVRTLASGTPADRDAAIAIPAREQAPLQTGTLQSSDLAPAWSAPAAQ